MNHSPKHQGCCFSQSVQYIIYDSPPPLLFNTCSIHTNITLSHFTFSIVLLFLESEVIILNNNIFYWPSFSLLFLTIPGDTGILDLADYLTFTLDIAYQKNHRKSILFPLKSKEKNNKVKQQNCVHRF